MAKTKLSVPSGRERPQPPSCPACKSPGYEMIVLGFSLWQCDNADCRVKYFRK